MGKDKSQKWEIEKSDLQKKNKIIKKEDWKGDKFIAR